MNRFYSGYDSFKDAADAACLYLGWLDTCIPFDVILSWLAIVGLGFLAYYMAKIVAKGL